MDNVRRVTAVLLGRIGDVIVATPFLRSLRLLYQRAHLRLVLNDSCAGLTEMIAPAGRALCADDIAYVYPWYLAPQNLQVAIFMQTPASELTVDLNPSPSKSAAALMALSRSPVKLGFDKGRMSAAYTTTIAAPAQDEPMLERYRRLAGALGGDYDGLPYLHVMDRHARHAEELLKPLGYPSGKINVAIHPGNFKKFDNRWPEEKFVALTNRLLENKNLALHYMAGPGERRKVEAIVGALKRPVPILPEASLTLTAAMLGRMSVFLGNITGTTHLAHGVGLPTFGIYSGYTNAVWRPKDPACGGVVSGEWESCRCIDVDSAYAQFLSFAERLSVK